MVRLNMYIEPEVVDSALKDNVLFFNEEDQHWYWNSIRLDSLETYGN